MNAGRIPDEGVGQHDHSPSQATPQTVSKLPAARGEARARLEGTTLANTFISTFQLPELGGNKILLFEPPR